MVVCRYLDATELMVELLRDEDASGIDVFAGDPDEGQLMQLLADAEIVLNGHTFLNPEHVAAARKLKAVVFLGSGAKSYMDVDALEARGVRVHTVSNYGDRAVAEHAFALMLAAARKVAVMDRAVRAGRWAPLEGPELEGRTLGVIGLGGIGEEMARMASAFGMKVLAWSRSPRAASPHYRAVGLDELLAESDVVSLHLALNNETKHLVDASRLARMKPGAMLVNTARAGLIDTAALREALKAGHLGHAALDVFDAEPLPADDPFLTMENVTLTAHAGYKTREASRRLLSRSLALARAEMERIAQGG